MSKLTLVATKFENICAGEVTYGFRMYDDYFTAYDNLMEAPETDDLKLLAYCKQQYSDSSDIGSALDDLQEMEKGIEINGQWYDWNEIKHLF